MCCSRDVVILFFLFLVEFVFEFKSFLLKLFDLIVGRDEECNGIIDNLVLNYLCVGVIFGFLGIGKIFVVFEVGYKFFFKGWNVCYYVCIN